MLSPHHNSTQSDKGTNMLRSRGPAQATSREVLTIQYLRGIAAAIVVLHHLLTSEGFEYLSQPLLGDFGVDTFFVISGFVMWYTTAGASMSPLRFWRRRIIRIVPLYWLFLSALVVATLLMPAAFNSTTITPENAVKSFLFIPHYHASQHIIAPILIPGWSLNYEMFFYFIFGLALFVGSLAQRFVALGFVLSALMLAGLFLHPTDAIGATYTNISLVKFLAGIILAIAYRQWILAFRPMLGVALVSVGLFWQFVYFSGATTHWLPEMMGLPPVLIVAGSLALESIAQRSPSRLLRVAGDASYSIYLSHLFFLKPMELAGHHWLSLGHSALIDVMYIALSFFFAICGGIAIYYAIERPITSFLRERRRSAVLISNSARFGTGHGPG